MSSEFQEKLDVAESELDFRRAFIEYAASYPLGDDANRASHILCSSEDDDDQARVRDMLYCRYLVSVGSQSTTNASIIELNRGDFVWLPLVRAAIVET